MTKEEAIALFNSEFWKSLSYEEIARFQFFEEKLCMPFDVFNEAMEKTLGRPVWTHEFASNNRDNLQRELLGEADPPTMEEIINLIPEDKRIIVHIN